MGKSSIHSNYFLIRLGLPSEARERDTLVTDAINTLVQSDVGLTDRDLTVIDLCMRGYKRAYVAKQLGCSIPATNNHLNRAFRLTGTHGIGQLFQWALRMRSKDSE
jgi:DNA-binding CsgD family transcriptional regulator